MSSYTQQDLSNLIELLCNNYSGVGTSRRQAFESLKQVKAAPQFCQLLCDVFSADQCPLAQLPASAVACGGWIVVRQIAGLTLKNNLADMHRVGGDAVLKQPAQVAGTALCSFTAETKSLARTAALITVKVTSIVGLEWWVTNCNANLATILLENMLKSDNSELVRMALITLGFLVEDAASKLGQSVGSIVHAIATVAGNAQDQKITTRALSTLCAIYEHGTLLEWGVENISPIQQGLWDYAGFAADCASRIAASTFSSIGSGALSVADKEAAGLTLRLCLRLFAYFVEYQQNEQTALARLENWGNLAVQILHHLRTSDPDTAFEACEFLTACVLAYERCGGDSPADAVVSVVHKETGALVPALFDCLLMKQEEEQQLLASDSYDQRDTIARRTSVKRRNTVRGEEDADDDVMDAMAALRAAASRTVTALSKSNGKHFFDVVFALAQQHFQHSDWHVREVAMLALCLVYDGCAGDMSPYLSALIEYLVGVVDRGIGEQASSQHIAETAMAIFSIGVFGEWATSHAKHHMPRVYASCSNALTTPSKKLQCAALSALKIVLDAAIRYEFETLSTVLPPIVSQLHRCVPVYHTNNLALLCDLVSRIAPGIAPEQEAAFAAPFIENLHTRITSFNTTLAQRYSEGDTHANVEKDCFDFARAIAAICIQFPTPTNQTTATGAVQWLIGVLQNVNAWHCGEDDADLIWCPLSLISDFLLALDDTNLEALVASEAGAQLPAMALAFINSEDSQTRSTCCSLYHDLLSRIGARAIPQSNMDAVLGYLVPLADYHKHSGVCADAALVVSKLVELFPNSSPALDSLIRVMSNQVRGDAYQLTASMEQLAQCVAICALHRPSAIPIEAAANLCFCLKLCGLNQYQAVSTKGCCSLLLYYINQPNADQLLRALMPLIYSWQESSTQYPELLQAIQQTFATILQSAPQLAQVLQQDVANTPAKLRAFIQQNYGV